MMFQDLKSCRVGKSWIVGTPLRQKVKSCDVHDLKSCRVGKSWLVGISPYRSLASLSSCEGSQHSTVCQARFSGAKSDDGPSVGVK